MGEEKSTNNMDEKSKKLVCLQTDESNQELGNPKESGDWKSKFFDMDLLSPIYLFLFIILFKDGIDGEDLHDAIIHFIMTYND